MKNALHERIHEELQERRYTTIPLQISCEKLVEAALAFEAFLGLPESVKEQLQGRLKEEDRGSRIGWRRRAQESGHNDNKEYFHFNEHVYSIAGIDDVISAEPIVQNFLVAADGVYHVARAGITRVLSDFEGIAPGILSDFFPSGKQAHFYLRFLAYYGQENDEAIIATPHNDIGGLTLGLHESKPGLRMGAPGNMQLVEHGDREAFLFPGYAFHQLFFEKFGYKPAWHDVIDVEHDNARPVDEIVRTSIVFFTDMHNRPDIPQSKTHTYVP